MVDLREEIEILREKLRSLEEKFHVKERVLYRGLNLSRNELLLVDALVKATGVVSGEWLAGVLEVTSKGLIVAISRLRIKLKMVVPVIKVINVSGEGYYIGPENRARLAELSLSTVS